MNAPTQSVQPWLLCSSAALSFALLSPAVAQAQDSPQSTETLEEVVVTAQKRAEDILRVPVAVTALPAQDLVEQNLVSVEDYARRVPSLTVAGTRTRDITVRGITSIGGASPTIAVTVDDVPIGSSQWSGNALFPDLDPSDIDHIEVLRGPQGTLYGASSLGGLIKIVTKDANPNEFSGRVGATYDSVSEGGDGYALRGAVNIPIWHDKLGVRLSAFKRDNAPLIDRVDRATGQVVEADADKFELDGFRGSVFFRPVEALTINISHLEQRQETGGGGATEVTPFPTDYKPVFDYFTTTSIGSDAETRQRVTQVRADINFGFATLSSVSGWNRISTSSTQDFTNVFFFVFDGFPPLGLDPVLPDAPAGSTLALSDGLLNKKFTQELRLASNGEGPFEWMVGLYYTDEDAGLGDPDSGGQTVTAHSPNGDLLEQIYINRSPATFEEKAAFLNLTYHFTDAFDVQVGGRYSKNEQSYSQSTDVFPHPTLEALGLVSKAATEQTSEDDSFTWQVSPRYFVTPEWMVYGRVATGYRPGGPNSAIGTAERSFDPDTVLSYELGVKGKALDNRLTLTASLFDVEWEDIIIGSLTLAGESFFDNGGTARSRGVEAEAAFDVGYGFTIRGNATFTDAELTQDLPPPAPDATSSIGRDGDSLPYSPSFTGNFGIEKRWSFARDYELAVAGNYTYVDDRDSNFRSTAVAGTPLEAKLITPSYDLVDLSASLSNRRWTASIFANNVTDERGITTVNDSGGINPRTTITLVRPRTIGLNFSYAF